MPSLRQSAKFDRSKLTDAPEPIAAQGPTSITPDVTAGLSPLMHCSMPLMASTFDSLTRQFYNNSRLPQNRILPVGGK